MAISKRTISRKTLGNSPSPSRPHYAFLIAVTLLFPLPTFSRENRPDRSPDGSTLAYTVQRGERRALLAEIWLSRDGGASRERIRTCPGSAGSLGFLRDGSALVYLERSLRYPAFGSYLSGGRTLPIDKNRTWLVNVDGSDESRWPLPPELNPMDIAVSPEGNRLAIRADRHREKDARKAVDMGAYRQHVVVEPYGDDRLQISDLELAWHVAAEKADSRFNKGDLNVVPMPSRTYKKGQSVFVYYEIYNIAKDAFGWTDYYVSYSITSAAPPVTMSNISRLFRWKTGKREELAVTYEQQGEAAQEVEYVELDLAELLPGRYTLKVTINDRNAGKSAEKDAVFVIAR